MVEHGGSRSGPYHAGELAVQRRAGVGEEAGRMGRMIGGVLPLRADQFLAEQGMAVAASLDADGRVWASLLTGPPGFLRAVDDQQIVIESRLAKGDPLRQHLAARPELGLLVIDLARRERLRVNGRGQLEDDRIVLKVEQAYGNCPKYIKPRRVTPVLDGLPSRVPSSALDARQQAWVAGADTLFIASYHREMGADASHRGGPPGFVSVLGPRRLSFPDYPGNNMFNTLGNITVEPHVGLLFLDFETGDTLQLTGRATIDWPESAAAPGPAAGRATVSFELDLALQTRGAGVKVPSPISRRPGR